MSALVDTFNETITTVFDTVWDKRDGRVVPETDDVVLRNGAVSLDVVVLYADLAHSTRLARNFPRSVAAKIVRAYLSTMTRLITAHNGSVRSFDGDRVMGVFIGGSKNSNAARCALKMNYVVTKMLRPQAEAKFPSLVTRGFKIAHCVGVASSEVFVVRGGVRGHNDLVFIGSAPNIAAKLSEVRNSPWHSYITHHVYGNLAKDAKLGSDGRNMWMSIRRTVGDDQWSLYKSNWHWKP